MQNWRMPAGLFLLPLFLVLPASCTQPNSQLWFGVDYWSFYNESPHVVTVTYKNHLHDESLTLKPGASDGTNIDRFSDWSYEPASLVDTEGQGYWVVHFIDR